MWKCVSHPGCWIITFQCHSLVFKSEMHLSWTHTHTHTHSVWVFLIYDHSLFLEVFRFYYPVSFFYKIKCTLCPFLRVLQHKTQEVMCAFWLCFYNTALVFNKLTLLPREWENMHTGCAGIAWRHFYAAIIKDVWFKATILVQPGMLEQEGLMAAAWGVGDGWHWLLRMLTALHQFDSGAAIRWRALCFKKKHHIICFHYPSASFGVQKPSI